MYAQLYINATNKLNIKFLFSLAMAVLTAPCKMVYICLNVYIHGDIFIGKKLAGSLFMFFARVAIIFALKVILGSKTAYDDWIFSHYSV